MILKNDLINEHEYMSCNKNFEFSMKIRMTAIV